MGLPFYVQQAETIGKITPNEFAKLNPYISKIPYIGQYLGTIGAVDTLTTNYSDMFQRNKDLGMSTSQSNLNSIPPAMMNAISNYMGGYSNPGAYGSGTNKPDQNWADYAGQVGGILGSIMGSRSAFQQSNYGGGLQGVFGIGQKINSMINPQSPYEQPAQGVDFSGIGSILSLLLGQNNNASSSDYLKKMKTLENRIKEIEAQQAFLDWLSQNTNIPTNTAYQSIMRFPARTGAY